MMFDRSSQRIEGGSPLLEGEGQGEVWSISGEVTHLTPALSFRERERVASFQTERFAR